MSIHQRDFRDVDESAVNVVTKNLGVERTVCGRTNKFVFVKEMLVSTTLDDVIRAPPLYSQIHTGDD